jgi:hypothetical protein
MVNVKGFQIKGHLGSAQILLRYPQHEYISKFIFCLKAVSIKYDHQNLLGVKVKFFTLLMLWQTVRLINTDSILLSSTFVNSVRAKKVAYPQLTYKV